jgi:hypothetical protein
MKIVSVVIALILSTFMLGCVGENPKGYFDFYVEEKPVLE